MSFLDDFKDLDAADVIGYLAEALDVIGKLAQSANGSNAADIVMAIKHIYELIVKASVSKVVPEEVMAELAKFRAGIRHNDSLADASIDAKFPKG